eukprot:m.16922 g.16922  ORF g.16922 m.16922 type:complete len:1504 (-) comp28721_c0_seq2:95-4606(-)
MASPLQWLAVLVLVCATAAHAECIAGTNDFSPCDDSNADTFDDMCVAGICVGTCFDTASMDNGQCVCPDNQILINQKCACPAGADESCLCPDSSTVVDGVCTCPDPAASLQEGVCACTDPVATVVEGSCTCPGDLTFANGKCGCVAPFVQLEDNECGCPDTSSLVDGQCVCPGTQVMAGQACTCTLPFIDLGDAICGCPGNSTLVGNKCVCPELTELVDNECVYIVTCPPVPAPKFGVVVSCASLTEGSVCKLACLTPNVAFGNLSRTCQSDGRWSGVYPTCHLPDPCITSPSPCSGESRCVADSTVAVGYRCVCANGATGIPGSDGTGCVVPSIFTQDGNVRFSVSSSDDTIIRLGAQINSVLDWDAQIHAVQDVGGILDATTSTVFTALAADVDANLSQNDTQTYNQLSTAVAVQQPITTANVQADLSQKISAAVASTSADASTKAAATLTTLNGYATSSATASNSQIVVQTQSSDTATLSSSLSHTEVMRQFVSTQISTLQSTQVVTSSSQSTLQISLTTTSTTIRNVNTQASSVQALYSGATASLSSIESTTASSIVSRSNIAVSISNAASTTQSSLTTTITNLAAIRASTSSSSTTHSTVASSLVVASASVTALSSTAVVTNANLATASTTLSTQSSTLVVLQTTQTNNDLSTAAVQASLANSRSSIVVLQSIPYSVSALVATVSTANSNLISISTGVSNLNKQIPVVQSAGNQLTTTFSTPQSAVSTANAALAASVITIQTTSTSLSTTAATISSTLSTAASNAIVQSATIATLQTRVVASDSNMAILTSTYASLTTQIAATSSANVALNTGLTGLQTTISSTAVALVTQTTTVQSAGTVNTARLNTLNTAASTLRVDYTATANRITSVSSVVAVQSTSLAGSLLQQTGLSSQIVAFTGRLNSASTTITSSQTTTINKNAALDALITSLSNTITTQRTTLSSVSVQLTGVQGAIPTQQTLIANQAAAQSTNRATWNSQLSTWGTNYNNANNQHTSVRAALSNVQLSAATISTRVVAIASNAAVLSPQLTSGQSSQVALNARTSTLEFRTNCLTEGYVYDSLRAECSPIQPVSPSFTFTQGLVYTVSASYVVPSADRIMYFFKTLGKTTLKIDYQDQLGQNIVGAGCSSTPSLKFRFSIDNGAWVSRAFNLRAETHTGWRRESYLLTAFFDGVPAGQHFVQLQALCACTSAVTQLQLGTTNTLFGDVLFTAAELPPSRITRVEYNTEITAPVNTYADSGRQVSFTKKLANTDLWVTYDDTISYKWSGQGQGGAIRLSLDGTTFSNPNAFYTSATANTGTFVGNPMSFLWYFQSVAAGSHFVRMQWYYSGTQSAMSAGYVNGDQHATFAVEERARGNLVFLGPSSLPQGLSLATLNAWTLVSGRQLTHTKLKASSIMRVTYADTFGNYMTAAGEQGAFRLRYDSTVTKGYSLFMSQTSALYWRMHPNKFVWYVRNLAVGSHVYYIDYYAVSGVSGGMYAAYPPTTNAFLIVEEIDLFGG